MSRHIEAAGLGDPVVVSVRTPLELEEGGYVDEGINLPGLVITYDWGSGDALVLLGDLDQIEALLKQAADRLATFRKEHGL